MRNLSNLNVRIALAMVLFLVAQSALLLITAYAAKSLGLNNVERHIMEATAVAIVVALGIWQLRTRLDRGVPVSIGLGTLRQAILKFLLGFGLLLAPLVASLGVTSLAGWASVSINWQSAQVDLIILGMISVFLTDAFPEELVFRGYIFSNLHENYSKWKSAVMTTILFVLFPVILIPLKGLLGPDISTGIVNSLSGGYIAYLLFFGAFAVYLRVLTNSIWTGVGFHLMFVYINQIMGLEATNLVQFTEFSNETLSQASFVVMLLLTFIGLLMYPRLKGVNLNWFGRKTEN